MGSDLNGAYLTPKEEATVSAIPDQEKSRSERQRRMRLTAALSGWNISYLISEAAIWLDFWPVSTI